MFFRHCLLFLYGVSTVLSQWWFISSNIGGPIPIPTDSFTVRWDYKEPETFTAPFTIGITYTQDLGHRVFVTKTTVAAEKRSTVLPPTFLPALRPNETSTITFVFYETSNGNWNGVSFTDYLLVNPITEPSTTTATVTITAPDTVTVTAVPTVTTVTGTAIHHTQTSAPSDGVSDEVPADTYGSELSTGAKAGIGVGVSAGVLLLVVVGGVLFVRWKRHGNASAEEVHLPAEVSEMEGCRRPVPELESKEKVGPLPMVDSLAFERQAEETYELSG